jgi:hypothetical protein
MADFVCRLGTMAGEVVTRTVDLSSGVNEARARLEREGQCLVTPPKTSGVTTLTRLGGEAAKQSKCERLSFLTVSVGSRRYSTLQAIAMHVNAPPGTFARGPWRCRGADSRVRRFRKPLLAGEYLPLILYSLDPGG